MPSASTTWHAVKVASNVVVAKDTATLVRVHHTRSMVLKLEHVLFQNARVAYQRVHRDMEHSRTPRDCMPESASRVTTSSHQRENVKVYKYVGMLAGLTLSVWHLASLSSRARGRTCRRSGWTGRRFYSSFCLHRISYCIMTPKVAPEVFSLVFEAVKMCMNRGKGGAKWS